MHVYRSCMSARICERRHESGNPQITLTTSVLTWLDLFQVE